MLLECWGYSVTTGERMADLLRKEGAGHVRHRGQRRWGAVALLLLAACNGGEMSAEMDGGRAIDASGVYAQNAHDGPESTTETLGQDQPGNDGAIDVAIDVVVDAVGTDAAMCAPETFAARFRVAVAQQSPFTCASPLPQVPVADADGVRDAVRAFVAGVRRFAPESLAVSQPECSTVNPNTCARHFQHDLYKSNGTLGERLFPLAEEMDACATSVTETIWVATVNGLTYPADVCLSGIAHGHLIGMVMFNDVQNCP